MELGMFFLKERCVLVIYSCVISYPKIQQLKATSIYYLTVLEGQESGNSLAGLMTLQSRCQPGCMRSAGGSTGLVPLPRSLMDRRL